MVRKLISLTLAALLNLSPNVPDAKIKKSLYGFVGTSSNSDNPVHLSFGGSTSRILSYQLAVGLDINILLENTDSETSFALRSDKEATGFQVGACLGVSKIHFKNPIIVSKPPVSEPIPQGSGFIRLYLSKTLTSNLIIKGMYQRNYSNEFLFNHSYPRHRFSMGLEKLIE